MDVETRIKLTSSLAEELKSLYGIDVACDNALIHGYMICRNHINLITKHTQAAQRGKPIKLNF